MEGCKLHLTDVSLSVQPRVPTLSGLFDASIMDVKLGRRSFSAQCPNTPKPKYFAKYEVIARDLEVRVPAFEAAGAIGKRDYLAYRDRLTTSAAHGFRLTALKHGSYRVSQAEGRLVRTREAFIRKLALFLTDRYTGSFSPPLCAGFVARLEAFERAVRGSSLLRSHTLVGSSLLLLHYGSQCEVRLVDFANTHPGEEDNGVLHGVRGLREALVQLGAQHEGREEAAGGRELGPVSRQAPRGQAGGQKHAHRV